MKKGWVYVASMSKRPGILKIGQSERDPEGRITEWSNETNGDITIECAALVDDPSTHKEMVWQQLLDTGFVEPQDSQESNLFSPQGIFQCELVAVVNVIVDFVNVWIWTKLEHIDFEQGANQT